MSLTKVEPRLAAEIERLEREGATMPISVLIQISPEEPLPETTTYHALAAHLTRRLPAIMERLNAAGFAGTISDNVLASSLEASLSPRQILAIIDLPAVKRVIWNRLDENVTC